MGENNSETSSYWQRLKVVDFGSLDLSYGQHTVMHVALEGEVRLDA
jgi:hypothetical protein